MKIIHISDTHEKHQKLMPFLEGIDADMIVHSGDVSHFGGKEACINFLEWFSALPFKHKILVPGNHDDYLEYTFRYFPLEIERLVKKYDVKILMNSGVNIDDVQFWGSPFTPAFCDMSFQILNHESDTFWNQVPSNTDVLITHGPAYGVLDLTREGKHVGCKSLSERIKKLSIKAHLFGHVHESYGEQDLGSYRAFNGAALGYDINSPHVFEVEKIKGL